MTWITIPTQVKEKLLYQANLVIAFISLTNFFQRAYEGKLPLRTIFHYFLRTDFAPAFSVKR